MFLSGGVGKFSLVMDFFVGIKNFWGGCLWDFFLGLFGRYVVLFWEGVRSL